MTIKLTTAVAVVSVQIMVYLKNHIPVFLIINSIINYPAKVCKISANQINNRNNVVLTSMSLRVQ